MGTLAGYEVGGLLGCGSMGQVFRARPGGGGEEVALKHLLWVGDEARVDQLRGEVEVLSRLGHPNIAKVVALIVDGNDLVIAMQLADGGSLGDLLNRGTQLPVGAASALLAKVGEALDAAHAAGVVHADLKPANVLLDAAGQPLLSDFGLVRHIASGSRSGGVGLGTVEYLDPAVAEGAPPSPASDVYSLGVLSYELLAGRLPYRGVTHHDTLRIAERGRLPPLAQTAPHIGAGLAAAVEQAMARRPAGRPSSAGEMADAIRGASQLSRERTVEGDDCVAGPRTLHRRLETGYSREEVPPNRGPNRPLGAKAVVVILVVAMVLGWRLLAPSAGATMASHGCGATSPLTPQATLVDVDGNGCRVPVVWSGGVVTVSRQSGRPPDRFALGQRDDVLLLGQWNCARAATPVLYRPATGEVFYFSRWAKPGRDASPSQIDHTGVVDGTARVVGGRGRRCDTVSLTSPR